MNQTTQQQAQTSKVCAWCPPVALAPGLTTSHGICATHKAEQRAALAALLGAK